MKPDWSISHLTGLLEVLMGVVNPAFVLGSNEVLLGHNAVLIGHISSPRLGEHARAHPKKGILGSWARLIGDPICKGDRSFWLDISRYILGSSSKFEAFLYTITPIVNKLWVHTLKLSASRFIKLPC